MRISIVSAITKKRGMARYGNGRALWYMPEDLQRFRTITLGHPVIMAQATYTSILQILGTPLPDRINIVISQQQELEKTGCMVVSSLEVGIQVAKNVDTQEIFIMGGAYLYKQAMRYVNRLYLTIVAGDYGTEEFFPPYDTFTEIVKEETGVSGKYAYTFMVLQK